MPDLKYLFSRLLAKGGWEGGRFPAWEYPKHERRRQPERRRAVRAVFNRELRTRCSVQEVGFGTYEMDSAARRIHCSPELRAIAGLSFDDGELSFEQFRQRVHPEDRERVMCKLEAALDPQGNGEFNDEHRLLRPDGAVVWVKSKGRTFFSGDGPERQPIGATGVVMDVTERKLYEAALALRERHFDQAVRGASVGVWNWDRGSGEVYWSERCRQLFGIPGGEAITLERFLAALHPEDRGLAAATIREALAGHHEYHAEYRILWPDGSIHWIESIGSAFYNGKSKEVLSVSGIALDITERKAHEDRLAAQAERMESRFQDNSVELGQVRVALEDSSLELQQFAYIAAHDMQTPLRSISGFAELLQREYRGRQLDERAELWLGQLVKSAERMHQLIRDLMTYSGVASLGRPFAPTDMNAVFDEVMRVAEPAVRESGATVTRDELPTVSGDSSQLAQLLQNLIENGIKFRGAEPPRVQVSALRQGSEWRFTVRDNGIGIAAKHREQIFDIFRRLHTQEAYAGTGIGLALCRRVVQRHGGRIWVESAPGAGSSFHFTLPAEAA